MASQGAVFGYGAIVPTEVYAQIFPYSFDYNFTTNEWEVEDEDELETGLVKVFHSTGNQSKNVFIATRSSVDYSFEKGSVWSPFVQVNLQQIVNEAQQLDPWLRQVFPNYPIGYLIYGYETD